MRVLVQRVSEASVRVERDVVASIGRGLLLLVGVTQGDGEEEAAWLARKCAGLRVFEDSEERMNLALAEVQGSALVVSQFTLYGDARKGRRPSWVRAAAPDAAEPLVERFANLLEAEGLPVERGRFGAMMQIHLVNDGPVTLLIEREPQGA